VPNERREAEGSPPILSGSRRQTLTPEQRRFMGTPRLKDETPREEEKVPERQPEEPIKAAPPQPVAIAVEEKPAAKLPEKRKGRTTVTVLKPDVPLTPPPDYTRTLLVVSGVIVLALTFYAGTRFPALLQRISAGRKAPPLESGVQQKYAGLTANELVAQALAAERTGNFQEAADKLIAAKHKDLNYRGILFRVGKLAYDHGDFDGADKLFERAIAFGENVDRANYLRGLLAVRRKDLPAAQRFFVAAATADPFTADYQYYWAEALRMDHRPNESMARYAQAASLASKPEDAALCQFKLRLARLEAGDVKMAAEIETKKNAGDLSVDWLMTEAALDLRAGHLEQALPLIEKASAVDPALFATCANDQFFVYEATKNAQLAAVLQSASRPSPNE
ncbi:MAG: tetratricopeptide repeat protein, partial [Chthoniobacterales bacterium]